MKRSRFSSLLLAIVCTLILALLVFPTFTTSRAERSAVDAVTRAWERARQAGSYRYTADVVQTSLPQPTITNVGQTSRQDEFHLEGETSLPDRAMYMHLWAQGGSVLNAESGAEIRIQDGRAFARQGLSPWEEVDDFTGLFAPQGDFMAFLSAAKDIRGIANDSPRNNVTGDSESQIANPQSEIRNPKSEISFYAFRVDGLSYARYLRDQIQQHMADKGELPPGVNLDLPRRYVDMKGSGELWVDSDGLPLRQIIHLEMPERSDVQIEADITVSFSDFGYAQGVGSKQQGGPPFASLRGQAGGGLTLNLESLKQAALMACMLALVTAVIVHPRSKKLYVALALTVIASMVLTPLLQSVHAADFTQRQAERAQEREQRQEESEMMRDARQLQASRTSSGRLHNPNKSPLEPAPVPSFGTGLARLTQSSPNALFNCQNDNGRDSDGDKLTDCQEELLGTNPNGVDSDGDSITDTLEIQGFEYPQASGKMWYTDPLEVDTNKDGINDMLEWNMPGSAHATWDTDGDGTPDLFDRDNDGDGVPDHLDLSPSTKGNDTFHEGTPLLLQMNNLEPGKPTYVEFQLRPTNPDHLWYAFNVLDWPTDNQAQVQDNDNKTFYDLDPNTALSPNSNGDLKLVPMLEIRISGDRTNLPSQVEQEHYGIFVVDMNQDGSDKAVYVPLNLVTDQDQDERSKSRVAFYGKMLYRPEESWGNAQQVRLVWLVQALVDICAEDGYKDGTCIRYEKYNQLQVIHTYYEAWRLTGLNVREDHGVDAALIYEDPAVDANINDDAQLLLLSHGLDSTFLAARDSDGVPGRDVTVNEIYRRFNHDTNAAVSDEERWGITNTLSVELHTYGHLDEAMVSIPMTDTKELLERVFSPYWSDSAPITPTLMLVREERFRATNLDVEGDSGNVSWDSTRLCIDLPPSGDEGVAIVTLAGINWAPYAFDGAAWDAYSMEDYWEELERRYPFSEVDDAEQAAGMTFFLQLYYLGVNRGADNVVQIGDLVMETSSIEEDAGTYARLGLTAGINIGVFILTLIVVKWVQFTNPERFYRLLGQGVLKAYQTVTTGIPAWAFSKEGGYIGVAVIVIGLVVAALIIATVAVTVWLFYKFGILQQIIAYFQDVYQKKWVQDAIRITTIVFKFVAAGIAFLGGIYTAITSINMWATVLSLVIELYIIWTVFLILCIASKAFPGSIAFNMLLAYTIAQTIMAVVIFAVVLAFAAMTIFIGLLIGAIIGLLIGLAEAVGSIWDFSPTEWVLREIVTPFYYGVQSTVDADVDVGSGTLVLARPEQGCSDGNSAKYAMSVTTTLRTKQMKWWQRSNASDFTPYYKWGTFVTTTFKYMLDQPSYTSAAELRPLHGYPLAEPGDMMWDWYPLQSIGWLDVGSEVPPIRMLQGQTTQRIEMGAFTPLEAGINQPFPVVLATGYVVPIVECWMPGWQYLESCELRMVKGQKVDDLGLRFDVFPYSLDGFHALTPTLGTDGQPDGGYRLSWDAAFATLKDADGDGLLSPAHNGPDPDDRAWDTDGDGLPDAYELELRQAGIKLSAGSRDTDNDGLSDAEEVRLGTNPAQADSDRDGLTDKQELDGWELRCGASPTHTLTLTWVSSDPTTSDTDGDGMNDLTEKTLHEARPAEYAFHPRVPNRSPVALFAAISDEDGIVAPGARVAYTASVQNNLITPLYAVGELNVDFPAVLGQGDIVTDLTLFMGQVITLSTGVLVPQGVASQGIHITNTLDTQLAGNPSCANLLLDTLHCVTQDDDGNGSPGEEPFPPNASEVIISLNGGERRWALWGVTNDSSHGIAESVEICNQATLEVCETDSHLFWPCDNLLESWTIDAPSLGSFSRSIDDLPNHFTGSLDYNVYYGGGGINLAEVVPLTIDAEPPFTSTVTSLLDGQYIQGNGQMLIVGGKAADLTSGIATVELSLNGGTWEKASGTESWAYPWQTPLVAGPHTLRTRATDVAGHVFTEMAGITVNVDVYAPDISTPIENGAVISAALGAGERWSVPLYGSVEDLLDYNGPPGSDVGSVEVLLEGLGNVAGHGWQTATLEAKNGNVWDWSIDYALPPLNNDGEIIANPSGEYRCIVRATDNAGNVTSSPLVLLLRIDNTAPLAKLTDTGPSVNVITQSLTIGGLITDPGIAAKGLASLEIAYVPAEIARATGGQDGLNWQPVTLAQAGEGVTRTTWSHVIPSNLEDGLYQINLRGTDVLGNRNDEAFTWPQWQGEIDIHAPQVEAGWRWAGIDQTARTEYTCWAQDFNLLEDSLLCPCPVLPGDRHYYDASWFRTLVGGAAWLYRIETSCLRPGWRPAPTVRACDRYGHCSQDTPSLALAALATSASPLDSVIFTPTHGSVLTVTGPISIAGGIYTNFGAGLRTMTVTVDDPATGGVPIYTKTWAPGASFGELWATTWLTPTEGPHKLMSVAESHSQPTPGTYYVQTDTHPITIVVDTQAPQIALPTGALTSTHRLPGGQVTLSGPYTETGGVASIRVRVDGGSGMGEWGDADADAAASAGTGRAWRYTWFLGETPDGKAYTFTACITDVVGRSAQQTGTLTLDLVPPAPVSVTLAYTNDLGLHTVITPGQTVRDAQSLSPTLIITWTASASSDLSHYYAGWTSSDEVPDPGVLTRYAPADRRHAQQVGQTQAHYAHVLAQDIYGNRQWQVLGPIYTDVPTTPDYIDLDYHGWMESGCSQIGADRELERYAQTGQALGGIQRFYATWNADTLRLAWTGANWNSDGDLFIYFDTAPGGSSAVYNPYASNTHITLPAQGGRQLEADYLVWVEDADTTRLLQWDGSGWVDAITDTLSAPPHYQLDTTLYPIHTDLVLPFSWLGITQGGGLKMVALASEEDTLQLWAAMPDKNPLNSQLAINSLAEIGQAGVPYSLTQQYEWDALAPGLCPNAGQFTDADVSVDISADPAGVEVGYLEHNLLHLVPGSPLDRDLDGKLDMTLPLDTDPGLIGHGMVVTYTLCYANRGTEVAPDMRVTVTTRGAVKLGSDPLVLNLGDVGDGVTATLQFTGVVDTSVYTASAEVNAIVADGTHGPFDWLWIQQDVDRAAPKDIEITAPLAYIRPYTNTVRGKVYDPSGVPAIGLEWKLLPFGLPATTLCTDPTPNDGRWSCDWSVGEAYNGDQFALQALGTDRFGNGPTASSWVTVTVDTLTPTIRLDSASETALQGAVLGPGDQILLSGLVEDDQRASSADICFAGTDEPTCSRVAVQPGTAVTGTWRYALRAAEGLDYEKQSITLYGVDGAGNRSSVPLSRTYLVDTVPPVVTVTTWVKHLPAPAPTLVLSGTVSDGSGSSDVYVLVQTPGQPLSSTLATRDGDSWSYTLHPATEGSYTLRIEARDAKGNARGYGPYGLFVGVSKIYLPLVLKNH
jgi:hypothetical protein